MKENKKEPIKISLTTWIVILVLIATIIAVTIFTIKNINPNKENQDKIISNTKYVEIQIEDTEADGLEYKNPVNIADTSIVSKLENIINSGTEYEPKSTAWPDISPRIKFYLENGEKYEAFAVDGMDGSNEEAGNYVTIFNIKNEEDKTTYKINEELEKYITELYNQFEETADDYIVLYNGLEIEKNTGVQAFEWAYNTTENQKKYNTRYYNYEKNEYEGETQGIFGKEEVYEGTSYVENVSTFAFSMEYDAMPRKSVKVEELPDKLKDMMDYNNVEIEAIDLDGDRNVEHIVCVQHCTSKEDYDVETNEAYSEIILFDSEYDKIATLASWNIDFEPNTGNWYLDLNDVTYIDIDNDEIMEIVIQIPVYEGWKLSILKYSDNKLEGEKELKVNIEP